MLSLWRLNAMKYPDCPPTKGTHWRVSSPTSGRSILMTRAPRSAKTMVQYGPERTRDMSMTVMPSSGGFCSIRGKENAHLDGPDGEALGPEPRSSPVRNWALPRPNDQSLSVFSTMLTITSVGGMPHERSSSAQSFR